MVVTCPEFQKAATFKEHSPSLMPLLVIENPFSRLAFELVGTLGRTKKEYIYLLTCIC